MEWSQSSAFAGCLTANGHIAIASASIVAFACFVGPFVAVTSASVIADAFALPFAAAFVALASTTTASPSFAATIAHPSTIESDLPYPFAIIIEPLPCCSPCPCLRFLEALVIVRFVHRPFLCILK